MNTNKKRTPAQQLLRLGGIVLGSVIYAAAIALFLDPNQLAP